MAKINQETHFNTTFSKSVNSLSLENTEPLVEHTLNRYPILNTRKNEAISDPGSISTTELLHKPKIIANRTWQTDQAVGAQVLIMSLLSIFESLNDSPGGQNLRGNAFFRSGLRIEAKLSSSPFHSGKLILNYIPPGVSLQFRNSVYAAVQFPCTYLDAGNSTTAVLNIPFFAIKDFFQTQNPDNNSDFGQFSIIVLNPLRIGTGGPTSVELTVTAIPTQNQIALPVRGHDITLQGIDSILPSLGSVTGDIAPDLTKILNPVSSGNDMKVDQLLQSIFQMISDSGTTGTPSMPPLTRYVDKPEKLPAHDSPNNTSSDPVVNTSAPTLSNVTGLNTEHLSLIPEQTMMIDKPTGEMNLKLVCKEPSLVAISPWDDSQTSGTQLIALPVDPRLIPATAQTTTGYVEDFPTYLSHVIAPFSYWRGSIDFVFTFAATEQHKGKILAVWVPNDYIVEGNSVILGESPTLEQLSLYPCEVFDLTLNKEFTFSVPYNSETPYKTINTDFVRMLTSDPPAVSDSYDGTLGVLYLTVFNKLSHPSTVTSRIEFNTYIKAGKDFEFRSLQFNNDMYENYQKIDYITLQSSDVMLESTRDGMRKVPVNRVGISPALSATPTFQEDGSEENLGILLQKYYPIVAFRTSVALEETRTVTIGVTPGQVIRDARSTATPPLTDPRWRNLIAHYRDIYAFWEGSLNFFILHNTTVNNPVILMASHNPRAFQDNYDTIQLGRVNGYLAPISISASSTTETTDLSETSIYSHISNLRVNPAIEITTPHRSIYRRLYTKTDYQGGTYLLDYNSTGRIDIIYSNPSAEDQEISGIVYQSIGDDFQFKYLIPPPSLLSRTAQ